MLTVGSLFSGIGGFDLGFQRAGFQIAWQCELEPFCRTILSAKLPAGTIYGDVCGMGASTVPRVDVLVGGFPCQDLSVAGQRKGLTGARSGLFFQFVRLIRELRPSYFVIENVPGFLSSAGGFDFATALHELDACGYVGGWRILDSQYFGLAQRRDRVFLVGCPRGFLDGASEILFESESGDGDSTAGNEAGEGVAATLRGRSARSGGNVPGRGGEDDQNLVAFDWQTGGDCHYGFSDRTKGLTKTHTPAVFGTLNSGGNSGGFRTEPGEHLVASTLLGRDANTRRDGMDNLVEGERARALVGSMFKRHDDDTDTLIPLASAITASAGHHGHSSPRGDGQDNLIAATLGAQSGGNQIEQNYEPVPSGVRRLTPLECERLQGFPPGWTCLCGEGHRGSQFCRCSDTPRYKALGNAVSVPVAEWIAKRILTL